MKNVSHLLCAINLVDYICIMVYSCKLYSLSRLPYTVIYNTYIMVYICYLYSLSRLSYTVLYCNIPQAGQLHGKCI